MNISCLCLEHWFFILGFEHVLVSAPRMVRVKHNYVDRIIVVCENYGGPQK